jgi:UDP-hydrolysing UDP-N-acetyl-D-glucosamine 2-epimerase
MTTPRKVSVFTATRAEYGLLTNLMRAVRSSERLRLQLLVSGAHLSPRHGETWRAIEADGFAIDARADLELAGDGPVETAAAMGRCTAGVAGVLERLRPDLFVVLGDRYEALAAAQAALVMGVPVAHLCGGEATEGAIDESLRHAITKLSALHFVATPAFAARVRQMGENPAHVHVVGTPGLDNFEALPLLDRAGLEAQLGFSLGSSSLLVTYHPATLGRLPAERAMDELLAALERFPEARLILTEPNADPGAGAVLERLRAFARRHAGRAYLTPSLGQLRYLSALKCVDAVVGNSSSGIIEAPTAGVPTVNVGDRQKGRPRAASVIDVAEARDDIEAGLRRALEPEFRALARSVENPYGGPGAARRIVAVLESVELGALRVKTFFGRD